MGLRPTEAFGVIGAVGMVTAVDDLGDEFVAGDRHRHGDAPGVGVADDVGERLLDDPEGCQLDHRRQLTAVGFDAHRGVEPARRQRVDEARQPDERWRRVAGRGPAAQQDDGGAQFAQGLTARRARLFESVPGDVGLLVERGDSERGLQVDRRHRVGEHRGLG